MPYKLEVKNLSFSYEDKPVLKDINLSVRAGEKVAVMGGNGAGKSTLFLNINGVLDPDEGDIFIDGIITGRKDKKRLHTNIGFVFQYADNQIIAPDVRSEISFGPMNMGLAKEEVVQRVNEAVDYMSLKDFEKRSPQYLSGGEKKRVTIADILAMKTDVLIFDEPMTSLDTLCAKETEDILNRLNSEGKTLIVSTHDPDFAFRFADRIVVMHEGRISADGRPYEIFSDEEVLRKAHINKPAVMTMWEALVDLGIVGREGKFPVSENEAVKLLDSIYKRKEVSQ